MKPRVLVIKLGSLGDILQISPVIDAMNDHRDSVIDVLTFDEHRPLFEYHPNICQIISLKRSFMSLLKIIARIICHRYDIGLNLHRSMALDALMFFCFVKYRVGFSSPEKKTVFLQASVPFNLSISRHHRYLSMVECVAHSPFKMSDYGLSYYKSPKAQLDVSFKGEPYVVIAPFGGHNRYSTMPSRVWPEYMALIELILAGFPTTTVVLTGGPEDCRSLEKMKSSFGDRVHVFLGNFDALSMVLESALCFIGNDSFPLFMAIASQCKALAIFGPTDSRLILEPYQNTYFVQSEVSCSPCYNPLEGVNNVAYHCPFEFKCMTTISAQKVFDKFKEICI
tara:strand:- start:486 stop:1499 length:1014 start_codon:yes stop_codon:yes gene_type:complete